MKLKVLKIVGLLLLMNFICSSYGAPIEHWYDKPSLKDSIADTLDAPAVTMFNETNESIDAKNDYYNITSQTVVDKKISDLKKLEAEYVKNYIRPIKPYTKSTPTLDQNKFSTLKIGYVIVGGEYKYGYEFIPDNELTDEELHRKRLIEVMTKNKRANLNDVQINNVKNAEIRDIEDPNIVVKHFNNITNDALTTGEALAMNIMMNETLGSFTVNPNGFGPELYRAYIVNGTNYEPLADRNIHLTADELYHQSASVKAFIDGMNDVVLRFSHMTRDQKVDFLMTKTPCDALTKDILDGASPDKLSYLAETSFGAFDNFPNYSSSTASIGEAKKMEKSVNDRLKTFNYDVAHNAKYFDLYGNENALEGDLEETKVRTVATLNKAIDGIQKIRDQFLIAGISILIASLIIIAIAMAFTCGTGCLKIMEFIKTFTSVSTFSNIFDVMVNYWEIIDKLEDIDINIPCPGPLAIIIGSILWAIGLSMLGLAIWFLVYSEVTMKNLQNRLIDVRNNIQTI
ncbi:MAG: hypothetical protein LBR15_03880 [Methanobrevibacter sp.]|jgi:hypothetical protein|nr:hypothetical protein [Candidatus Methanovirga australis]